MKKLCIVVLALCTLPSFAAVDENIDKLYNKYVDCYTHQHKEKEFYALSDQLKKYYQKTDQLGSYYKIEMNEAIYLSEHNNPHQGIKKSIEVLNNMKENSFNGLNLVYLSLGTIFESCGNQSIAMHYYQEAIDHTNDHDDRLTIDAYSRMAGLLKLTNPTEASKWNQKYQFLSIEFPSYHHIYLFTEAVIAFAKNNKAAFLAAQKAYFDYREQHSELDNYGVKTMNIMDLTFKGNYKEALQILDSSSNDAELTEITKHDLRQNIYQIQGNLTDAFEEMKKRAWCSDSLMAKLQLHNLQDMATEAQLVKTQKDAAANRMRMMTIILLLAAALIILLAVFNYLRQKSRQNLAEKNEQLKHALSMAEESDKMKTEFVRSVSHEIRTPLNAIMGFADVITTPGLELPEVDRQDLINRINDNTKAITRIVDDMLHASELSSTDYYANEDSILLNQFLSQELYSYRDKVTSKIELIYTTSIINRFTLNSNKKGLEQILTHLIDNAVKFTQSGTIELNCRQSNRGEIVISLTDTGCGIAKDQQEKIFENFYKVDYFQQGIGLGLSVSKKIAQKLGGDLTLDPDYTNGTRFVLTLPIS